MTRRSLTQREVDDRFQQMLGDDADQSPSARKRRRILRAAYALFLERGYRKTSIDDVARKAEVAKGTVYLYFENKGQLLIHAIALEKASLRSRISPLFDGSVPKGERLGTWVRLALTSARDLPLVTRIMSGDAELFAALEDAGSQELTMRFAEGAEWLMDLIEDAAPGRLDDDEKRVRADVLMGITFLAVGLLDDRVRSGRSLDAFAETLADMVVHGIGGEKKT